MNKLWFRRKRYGWGWYPVTWQGWLVVAGYVLLVALLAVMVQDAPTQREFWLMFFLPISVLTTLLLVIAYRKGEKPRWQWGRKDEDNDS